jgi:hypothetical protein
LRALRGLGRRGALKLSEGVIREIKRGTDKLAQFVEKEEQVLEITISNNPFLSNEIARLERSYGEKIAFGQQNTVVFGKAGRVVKQLMHKWLLWPSCLKQLPFRMTGLCNLPVHWKA